MTIFVDEMKTYFERLQIRSLYSPKDTHSLTIKLKP